MSMKRDAAWTALDTFTSSALAFAFRLVVAKMLAPHDFGVAALAITVITVLQVINDFGLTAALIQKDESKVTADFINSTFTASLLVTIILAAFTLLVVAPASAAFFDEPTLWPIISALSLSLLPSPVTTVTSAILYRKRNFKAVAINRVYSTLFSLIVSSIILWMRPDPWVLVWQTLIASSISAVGLIYVCRWRFRLIWDRKSFSDIFGFSGFVLANDITVSFSANVGVFILGRVLSPVEAGMFSLALYMTDTVRRSLMSILNRVTFVRYSQIKNDNVGIRNAYISTLMWNCRLLFPIMTVFMLFGPSIVIHFLGQKWVGLEEVLRWLSLSVMIHAAGGTTSTLYKGIGRPGLDLALFLSTTCLILLPAIVVGAFVDGLVGVAIATAAAKLVSNVVRQIFLDRIIGRTALLVIKTVGMSVLTQIPIVALWLFGIFVFPQHGWLMDAFLAGCGLILYGLIEVPRAFPNIRQTLKRRLG